MNKKQWGIVLAAAMTMGVMPGMTAAAEEQVTIQFFSNLPDQWPGSDRADAY